MDGRLLVKQQREVELLAEKISLNLPRLLGTETPSIMMKTWRAEPLSGS